MNFTTPTAFWWAALALPIVVFYILKIRMRRIPVSTIMFWQQVFEEKQPRSLWQTLRHWLSLLLQLIFLFLLVGALTDPFFASEEQSRRRLVVVLDNSASMLALEGETSRFDAARKEANNLINSLRVKDEMAIISAGTQPKVVCGLTGHQRTLRDALRTVTPTDGTTEVSAAVDLARRLLAGHENAKVVVLSDGCFDGAEAVAGADDVVWQRFGGETGNVAITRFQVRRSVLDPIGYEVFIEVRNLSEAEVDTRLELTLGEEIVDVIPLKLTAGETWTKIFEQTAAAGGRLTASVDYTDALAADNKATAILPERKRIPVVLVSAGHLFLERVLVANSLVDLKVVAEPPSRVDPGTIVVYHKITPAQVPAGNVLFIDPEGTTDLWETGDVIEQPIVATQDKDHALMTYVRLDNVLLPEARRLKPKGDATVLVASAEEDPLYFAATRPTGNVLVLTVNLDRGDLPLRTAFPILITNALNWFTGEKGELQEASAAGDVAEVDVTPLIAAADSASPESIPASDELVTEPQVSASEIEQTKLEQREFVLTAPDGTTENVTVLGEKAMIGPLDRCGVWTLTSSVPAPTTTAATPGTAAEAPPVIEIACNLSNPRESDLRGTQQSSQDVQSLQAGLGGKPIWFYLALVACALVATEWYLYQRRWIT